MIHIVARLVATHVAHHVARHVTNQVAQHAAHHVARHVTNQVAQHATHHVATAAQQTTQNAGASQKLAEAGTLLGAANAGAGLYTKIKHDRDAKQAQKEQEKQAIRGQIQALQQQLANLEK